MNKLFFSLLFLPIFSLAQTAEPLKFVNPFIGTGGHGHTFPGATAPFGMVQLSPDTRIDPGDWDGCGGYHFSDSLIYGFSHTHLSGTGVSDFCDLLFMPFTGRPELENSNYRSFFKKKNEVAEPGFYAVFLEKDKIKAELTATERVGLHRYTFPKNRENGYLLIDLRHRDLVLDSHLETCSDREIAGYRFSKSWAAEQHLYFVARFSKPFSNPKLLDMAVEPHVSKTSVSSKSVVGILQFVQDGEPLVVTVGISAVSIEGARKNLETEANHFDFDKIKTETQAKWASQLSKIEVEGGTVAQKTSFYTALYHTLVVPNIFSDVDGKYRGRDQKIHESDRPIYSVFSLWDTHRAANPLYTLLEPTRTQDFVNTFLKQYDEGSLLPVWELAANETECMIGYHAVPVIADAWSKYLRNFDSKKALEAMQRSADANRFGLEFYRSMGYIPSEKEPESVAKTLEYAFDDWAIARMAESIGNQEVAQKFYQRGQFYKNIFDSETGFFRAKNNSAWYIPFDPFEVNFNYTEANAWQYRFSAQQDVSGLVKLHGGREKFLQNLDELFAAKSETSGRNQSDMTGLIGQYVQGNEPSHHIAYLYNFAGQPSKTQQRVHEIMQKMYSDQPDGLSGNEDCGQMSAWLVFSAMGFYPAVPVGGQYVFGTPLFEKTVLNLPNGKKFTVQANGISDKNFYIKNATLNGLTYSKSWISHEILTSGGELVFEMTDQPSSFGTAENDWPVSKIDAPDIVPIPFLKTGKRVFKEKQSIELGCLDAAAAIFYTTDGSEPTEKSARFSGAFEISETMVLKSFASKNGKRSGEMVSNFSKMRPGLKIEKYNCQFNNQYTGRGETGLIDQIRGAADFRSGDWQGFDGQNFDVVFDLGKKKKVEKVVAGFLQDNNSWIFFPEKIRVEISDDGKNFQPAGEISTKNLPTEMGMLLQDFTLNFPKKIKTRFVRVVSESLLRCPAWHKGAGNPCWLMIDEVEIF